MHRYIAAGRRSAGRPCQLRTESAGARCVCTLHVDQSNPASSEAFNCSPDDLPYKPHAGHVEARQPAAPPVVSPVTLCLYNRHIFIAEMYNGHIEARQRQPAAPPVVSHRRAGGRKGGRRTAMGRGRARAGGRGRVGGRGSGGGGGPLRGGRSEGGE